MPCKIAKLEYFTDRERFRNQAAGALAPAFGAECVAEGILTVRFPAAVTAAGFELHNLPAIDRIEAVGELGQVVVIAGPFPSVPVRLVDEDGAIVAVSSSTNRTGTLMKELDVPCRGFLGIRSDVPFVEVRVRTRWSKSQIVAEKVVLAADEALGGLGRLIQ